MKSFCKLIKSHNAHDEAEKLMNNVLAQGGQIIGAQVLETGKSLKPTVMLVTGVLPC